MAADVTSDYSELLALARTIYGEARGESPAGREAVGRVVMNRVNAKEFPNTISDVCLQPKQFSCWNDSDPNYKLIKSMMPGANPTFDECLATAEMVMNSAADNTGGATHYYSKAIAEPVWARGAAPTAEIGMLRFYRNIR